VTPGYPARGLTRLQLFLLTAAWIATVANLAPLRQFAHAPSAGQGAALVAFVFGGWLFIFTLTTGLLFIAGVLFPGRGAKVLVAVMLVASATLSYFSLFLGTQFEKSMLGNILQTDYVEAYDLLSLRVLAWVAVTACCPRSSCCACRCGPSPSSGGRGGRWRSSAGSSWRRSPWSTRSIRATPRRAAATR
jgi:glucan phosphoethanolaminetransferase (alkaline phosphatase superfamily)